MTCVSASRGPSVIPKFVIALLTECHWTLSPCSAASTFCARLGSAHRLALMPRRLALPLLVGAITCIFGAPSPALALEVYPSYSPAVLSGPPPWTVTYKFELDTGPTPETVSFGGEGDGLSFP